MCTTTLRRKRRRAAEQQDFRCWYCTFPMWEADPDTFAARHGLTRRMTRAFQCTAEHLVPRSLNGTNAAENIVAACAFCNFARHRRKRPPAADAYRARVTRRMGQGRWHGREFHAAFGRTVAGGPAVEADGAVVEAAETGAPEPFGSRDDRIEQPRSERSVRTSVRRLVREDQRQYAFAFHGIDAGLRAPLIAP